MIEVYECGSVVNIKAINLKGYLTGICIRDGRITYEVSYFSDGNYKQSWFCDYEIDFDSTAQKIGIGYKS